MNALRFLLVAMLIAVARLARAESAKIDTIELAGVSATPILLKPDILAGLPQVEADVSFGHNEELSRTFGVTGRDGYNIAFSVDEIHPEFGNRAMMVATEVDGKPFPDGLRSIVPGNQRGARNVREAATIELR